MVVQHARARCSRTSDGRERERPHESHCSRHELAPCMIEPPLDISNLLITRIHVVPSMQMNRILFDICAAGSRIDGTTVHRLDDTIARNEHHRTSYHTCTRTSPSSPSAKRYVRTTSSTHIMDSTTLYLNAMRKAGSSQYPVCRVSQ